MSDHAADTQTRSMYERLGVEVIRIAVDRFYDRILADDRLAQFFSGSDPVRLRRHQALLIGQVLGGPVSYPDVTVLATVHRRLNITNDAYWLVVGHLVAVLTAAAVPRDIVMHLVGTLYDVRELIVAEPVPVGA